MRGSQDPFTGKHGCTADIKTVCRADALEKSDLPRIFTEFSGAFVIIQVLDAAVDANSVSRATRPIEGTRSSMSKVLGWC